MQLTRSSGILMHISSLPSRHGIGDLGAAAYEWVDMLHASGTKYWQMLPLTPTGYGNSPYQGLSAFAGNPLFIDPEELVENGLLDISDSEDAPGYPKRRIDFKSATDWKNKFLRQAYQHSKRGMSAQLQRDYEAFLQTNEFWLDDFAIFMAIREAFGLVSWSEWPQGLRNRSISELTFFCETHNEEIGRHRFLQFLFSRQWKKLKSYANRRGIQLIGDIPIFVGFDCADVWAHPQLFQLNEQRQPVAVAGVPPDFFSKTGQLWGNPLYDWERHEKDGYDWWIRRVRASLNTVDLIRLDHFRGFAGYYRIPAGEPTAENGEWVSGPGQKLFDALQHEIGDLPFIAEDLGVITEDVVELRKRYHFPGMRILQFAFSGDADDEFLPHNYPQNCVAYTGTHDNDTSVGWFQQAPRHERKFCASYLGNHTRDIAHEMIRTIWRSNALIAIAPAQDFLRYSRWARMNLPATTAGNWLWIMRPGAFSTDLVEWIKEINITFGRVSDGKDWEAKSYFSSER